MHRRALLAALAASLAGCGSRSDAGDGTTPSPDGTPATPTSGTPAETPTPTATEFPSPTETEPPEGPCVGGGRTRYALGEFHEMRVYRLAVTDVQLLTTLDLDDGTTHELPEDRQFALTTYLVENRSEDSTRWAGGDIWGYVVAPCRFYDLEGLFYPDRWATSLGITDLRQVEHVLQDRSHGAEVAAGEQRRFWHSTLLPRDVTTSDVEVGFRRKLSGPFPVRWVPR